MATGYGLDGPVIESRWEARFSAPVRTGPEAHPASCTMGTGSFPGVKSGRGVTLTPHPLLEPWSWKSRAIPLLPQWAVRPVQSLSACTSLHFTCFTLYNFVAIIRRSAHFGLVQIARHRLKSLKISHRRHFHIYEQHLKQMQSNSAITSLRWMIICVVINYCSIRGVSCYC